VEGERGTALHAAACNHYPGKKILELLINAGADVNQEYYGTALQAAAAVEWGKPSLEAVQIVIRAGADVNLVGGQYSTALQAAAYNAWHEIVEELINAGANVNLVGGEYGTALRAAVLSWNLKSCIDVVQMLVQAGADINLKGGEDTTPLEAALAHDCTEIAQILLDAGAKPRKHPLLFPADMDAGEREEKRPRICDCTVADAECDCTTWCRYA
jgi:ankyrin repeat domain-containing protein 50